MEVVSWWTTLVGCILSFLVGLWIMWAMKRQEIDVEQERADRWQRHALEADKQVDELLSVLADEPGARPVPVARPVAWSDLASDRVIADLVEERDLPMFPTRPGAEKYPFAAAAGLVPPEISDVWPGYAEAIEAQEQDAP
jgi:hypothetical protein